MSTQPNVTMQKPLYGFRVVKTHNGDTLHTIALRELGDAKLWQKLIDYNGLVPPYITDNPANAGPGVILTGGSIKVPAPAPVTTSTTNPDDLFLTDIQLTAGRIIANSGGDVATVTGYANLNQALSNRLNTPRGRLMMHPKYGSLHQRMKGVANGPTQGVLTANYARGAVKADPRVSSIVSASAQITGDATEISIVAQPISGGPTTTVTVTSK